MCKRLGIEERISSIGALQQYYFKHENCTGQFITRVEVFDKKTKETEPMDVNVNIAFDTITQRINIMWEDAGYTINEFRDNGLFGYYDCAWVPMNFEHNTLEINSPDSDKIIYVS